MDFIGRCLCKVTRHIATAHNPIKERSAQSRLSHGTPWLQRRTAQHIHLKELSNWGGGRREVQTLLCLKLKMPFVQALLHLFTKGEKGNISRIPNFKCPKARSCTNSPVSSLLSLVLWFFNMAITLFNNNSQ